MEVTMSQQLKDKIANPEGHFDKPKDVVQDPGSRMNNSY
jgi:hypothetical protein